MRPSPPFLVMPDVSHLTDLQLAVLRIVWARGGTTVPEVFRALWDERRLAQSTVATVISRLERRGVLTRQEEGRQFVYRAAVTEEEVRTAMVAEVTSLLFRGDASALVSHLVEQREIASGDLDRARALLDSMAGDDDADAR